PGRRAALGRRGALVAIEAPLWAVEVDVGGVEELEHRDPIEGGMSSGATRPSSRPRAPEQKVYPTPGGLPTAAVRSPRVRFPRPVAFITKTRKNENTNGLGPGDRDR